MARKINYCTNPFKGLIYKVVLAVICGALFVSHATSVVATEASLAGCIITKKAFMAEIAEADEQKKGTGISLSEGGVTEGILSVAAGTSELREFCRDWLAGEINKQAEEANTNQTKVAWDALLVIVHPDNPDDDILMDRLKDFRPGKLFHERMGRNR